MAGTGFIHHEEEPREAPAAPYQPAISSAPADALPRMSHTYLVAAMSHMQREVVSESEGARSITSRRGFYRPPLSYEGGSRCGKALLNASTNESTSTLADRFGSGYNTWRVLRAEKTVDFIASGVLLYKSLGQDFPAANSTIQLCNLQRTEKGLKYITTAGKTHDNEVQQDEI